MPVAVPGHHAEGEDEDAGDQAHGAKGHDEEFAHHEEQQAAAHRYGGVYLGAEHSGTLGGHHIAQESAPTAGELKHARLVHFGRILPMTIVGGCSIIGVAWWCGFLGASDPKAALNCSFFVIELCDLNFEWLILAA